MIRVSRLKKNNELKKMSRLRRIVIADWQQIDLSDPNLIQDLTDSMTYSYPLQINYEGSGWRNIQPYGWNTSKDGNVLIMCYKDSGEVRSYRLDKVLDMYIDMTANSISMSNNPQMNDDEQTQIYENIMEDQKDTSTDMPSIPKEQEEINQSKPGVFDDELSILDDSKPISTIEEPIAEPTTESVEEPIVKPVDEEPVIEEPIIKEPENEETEIEKNKNKNEETEKNE